MLGNIVLIDSRVSNYQTFIDTLAMPSEVFIIDAKSDGVAQIAARLQGRSGIDALHIIGHGSQGALYLGATVLDSGNLASYAAPLASIGSALTQSGDILLYGCNVAQGDPGLQFIGALAQATGADVAASSDATGTSVLGGDAVLELSSGNVETASLALNGLSGLLGVAGDGMVITDLGSSYDYGQSVTLQADNKILLAGYSYNSSANADFALVRYNSNGSLDTSFSDDGKLTIDFGSSYDVGKTVRLQADGKILLAGYSGGDFALLRYNSDGSLDTSFSGDGMLTTDFGFESPDNGYSVTLQADGKILLAGSSYSSSGYDFALVRYNSDGSLDRSFGYDGMLTTDFGESHDYGYSVALQADGKILLAGCSYNSSSDDFELARYNSDGSLDTSFSGDGKLTTDFGLSDDDGQSVTVQADGKILLAGCTYKSISHHFALARYNSDGSLDTSFSGDGKLTTDFGSYDDYGQSVTVQADGKILLAGYSDNSGFDFALARYNSDGSLDTSFSGDGKLTTDFGSSDDCGYSVALQADGKILLAGYSRSSSDNEDFALARYNSDGSLDTSFGSPNNAPTGSVTITGTAMQGQTLTAANTLADLDGLGTISYQWLADGTAISGATASTLVLGAAQVGKAISVKASYIDGQATAESVTSTATGAVAALLVSEPGVTFRNATALTTTEDGGNVAFQAVLNAAPRHDVVLTLSINDATEGTFQASGTTTTTVTFTASNWNVAQTVTLAGVDDKPNDGDMAFIVSTSVTSDDLRYDGMRSGAGLSIANVVVTNTDNDAPDEWYGDAGGIAIADQHFGGNGASDIYGLNGRDELYGNNGDDRVYGGYGDDVLYGEADNDELEGEQGNDKLSGGTGNDNLKGGTGQDTLLGGDGNDTLNGGEDADSMNGGNGADTYYVDNPGDIVSDSGTDTGKDTVYVTAFLATGYTLGAGIDNAALQAQATNAALTGNTGNNSLSGNASDNALNGGAGNDSLSGGLGNDILYAGSGDDVVDAGDGNDLIVGGDGAGNDRYSGGAGTDTVKYTSATAAISVNLGTGSASGTDIGSDALAQIENVIGGKGSDTLIGNTLANSLTGDTGNDTLDGGAGADKMQGGLGNDSYCVRDSGDAVSEALSAGTDTVLSYLSAYTLGANVENGRILSTGTASLSGNASGNMLYAGAGNNALSGGAGTDTVSYQYAGAAVKVSLAVATGQLTGGSGTDTLSGIESLAGSNFSDTLSGSTVANSLAGGAGNDILSAGAGNDVLAGGLGADKLTGGSGADRFDFNVLAELVLSSTTRDTIADFKASEADKIDLLDVDANTALTGNQAFSYLGTAAFSGDATAKLRFDALNHILYGSTDADTTAEFAIVLTGVASLAGTSLVL